MSTPDPYAESAGLPEEASQPPDFSQIAKDLLAGVIDSPGANWLAGAISDGLRQALVAVLGFIIKEITEIIGYFVETFLQAAEAGDVEIAKLASAVVSSLLDQDVPAEAFKGVTGKDQRKQLAGVLGKQVITAMFGANLGETPQTLAPSSENAASFAGAAMHLAVEGWLEGMLAELLSLGQIEQVGQLKDTIINAMGIGRLMRRVLAPPTTILIEDPFTWKLNLAFRPKLLGEGQAVKQHIRGRWDAGRLDQELGRQGYGAEQIEAAINDGRKFLSEADLALLVRYGKWDAPTAKQHLKDQGYEDAIAQAKLDLEQIKRTESILGFLISGVEDARIRGYVDNIELRDILGKFPIPPDEVDLRARIAATRAELPRAELTIAELVKGFNDGVLDLTEFRANLQRRGYTDQDEQTLELIYVTELKSKVDAAAAKKKAAEDKAKAKAAAAKAKADKAAADKAAKEAAATTKAQAKADAKAQADAQKQAAAQSKAAAKAAAKTAADQKKQQLADQKAAAAAQKAADQKAAKAAAAAQKATDQQAAADQKAKAKADAKAAATAASSAARQKAADQKAADQAARAEAARAAKAALDAQKSAEKAALEAQKAAERLALEQAKAALAAAQAAAPPKPKKTTPPAKKTAG